jgi:hypothetical protein
MPTDDPKWVTEHRGKAMKAFEKAVSPAREFSDDDGNGGNGNLPKKQLHKPVPLYEMKGPLGDAARAQARADRNAEFARHAEQAPQAPTKPAKRPPDLKRDFDRVR